MIQKKDLSSVAEYKRKCNHCGKVWYSSISRERQMEAEIESENLEIRIERERWAGESHEFKIAEKVKRLEAELLKQKQCPQCRSHFYTETEVLVKK